MVKGHAYGLRLVDFDPFVTFFGKMDTNTFLLNGQEKRFKWILNG